MLRYRSTSGTKTRGVRYGEVVVGGAGRGTSIPSVVPGYLRLQHFDTAPRSLEIFTAMKAMEGWVWCE